MNRKYLFLFFIAGLIAFLPISCDIKNPVEGISVRVKNIPRTTSIRIEFFETNSGILVNTPFTIVFGGKNKNDVISDVNEPITQLEVKNGIAYFALKDNLIPSNNNPAELMIITKSTQHLSTSEKIYINKTGTNNYSVFMMKLSSSLPTGVTNNNQSFGNVATNSGITTLIEANSGGTYSAKITIPPGTILKDANGNSLSGNVTSRVTYFDPTQSAAIPNFPGGFNVSTNNSGNGGFVSAGFASINLFVDNVAVRNFSQPVSVQIGVNPSVINPTTNTNVRPGDIIPLWSYEEESGIWKFEGNYVVQSKTGSGGNQELFVKKDDVTHLSWYNLDWFYNSCFQSVTINIQGGCWNVLWWYLEYVNGQGFVGSGLVFNFDPSIIFLNAPSGIPVKLLLFSSYQSLMNYWMTGQLSNTVGSLVINDLCQTGSVNIQVNTQSLGQNINFTVRGVCPNGNILDQGTLDIEIFKDGFWQYAGRMINGNITINCLQVGQTYNFRTFYNGEYYYRTQEITSTNMLLEIPLPGNIDFCL